MLNASDCKLLAIGNTFKPLFDDTPPIKILQGTFLYHNKVLLVLSFSLSVLSLADTHNIYSHWFFYFLLPADGRGGKGLFPPLLSSFLYVFYSFGRFFARGFCSTPHLGWGFIRRLVWLIPPWFAAAEFQPLHHVVRVRCCSLCDGGCFCCGS